MINFNINYPKILLDLKNPKTELYTINSLHSLHNKTFGMLYLSMPNH